MFTVGQYVQINNHSEPQCNGKYGTVVAINPSYNGVPYYYVELEGYEYCDCTDDELMEG